MHDPLIKVLYNRRGVSDYALYDEAGIKERTGVTPAQYLEYAALRGDPSDNLPGVPGVGEKTAAKLINTYGGLDGIFANVDAQTPKLRASLAEHEAQVPQNPDADGRCAATCRSTSTSARSAIDPNQDEVKRLFEFLEFRTLFDRLQRGARRARRGAGRGGGVDAEVLDAGDFADVDDGGRRGRRSRRRWSGLDVAAAWAGDPGRSDLLGLAVVTDAATSRCRLARRRRCSTTDRRRRGGGASGRARPQRQGR